MITRTSNAILGQQHDVASMSAADAPTNLLTWQEASLASALQHTRPRGGAPFRLQHDATLCCASMHCEGPTVLPDMAEYQAAEFTNGSANSGTSSFSSSTRAD